MAEGQKVYKVIHKKWRGNGKEHTYNEAFIDVVAGVAHCKTKIAADVLVNVRGYRWLDARDDVSTPEGQLVADKRAKIAERMADIMKSAGKGIKKVAEAFKGSGSKKGKTKKESPKESESKE